MPRTVRPSRMFSPSPSVCAKAVERMRKLPRRKVKAHSIGRYGITAIASQCLLQAGESL